MGALLKEKQDRKERFPVLPRRSKVPNTNEKLTAAEINNLYERYKKLVDVLLLEIIDDREIREIENKLGVVLIAELRQRDRIKEKT